MKKLILLILLFTILSPIHTLGATHKLAIVIDDFGNQMKGTEEMLSLKIPITVAVMPFLRSSTEDAQKAHQLGKEVIIHLQMEPVTGKRTWLGPKPITTDLSNSEIRSRVLSAIEDVPYAVGINNHTGSKATADERVMRVILTVCKEKGLFFLDSKTSMNSVVGRIAKELNVPYMENNIFFDHSPTFEYVTKQANQIIQLSKTRDIIAIGHVGIPGEITSSVISKYSPLFQEHTNVAYLSDFIKREEYPITIHQKE